MALAAVYARGAVLHLLQKRPHTVTRATVALQAAAGLLFLAIAANEILDA